MRNTDVEKVVTAASQLQARRLATTLNQLVEEKELTQAQADAVIVRLLMLMGQPVG